MILRFVATGNDIGRWWLDVRGNIEAFVHSASENKMLQMHIGGHTDESAGTVGDAVHDMQLGSTPPESEGTLTYAAGPEAYRRGLAGLPIEVEIRVTSMVFGEGDRIRLDVNAHDGQHFFAAYNLQDNTIYTGGERASCVLLPLVPAR